MIRTKTVATIGPSTNSVKMLVALAQHGCDVFRINFSHGNYAEHQRVLDNLDVARGEVGRALATLGDLCGPKIRVGNIAGGSVLLGEGQEFIVQRDPIEGNSNRISTSLVELADLVRPGQRILLDDGKLALEVVEPRGPSEFLCRVERGGILASGKGINLPHTELALSALTAKDRQDIGWIAQRGLDYVALSFVQSADDVLMLRRLLDQAGSDAHIVAKIEKPKAVENIDEIIEVADAIMIARGDLGVEMSLAAVPVAQKRIARLCQSAGKPCIIATQMLESMTHASTPTRAEVSDVANAVLDHADAVMLSGETAVGKFPVEAVTTMNDVLSRVQAYDDETSLPRTVTYAPARTAAALAAAVREILATEDIAAVAVFTYTGTTVRMFSKNRLPCPILGISPDLAAVRRMCLYYGVITVKGDKVEHTRDVLAMAARFSVERGIARPGDRIVVVSGRPLGRIGTINTLVIHTIPE
jgi:pyruvate kinase